MQRPVKKKLMTCNFTPRQKEALESHATSTQVSLPEVLRRIVDDWMEKQSKTDKKEN